MVALMSLSLHIHTTHHPRLNVEVEDSINVEKSLTQGPTVDQKEDTSNISTDEEKYTGESATNKKRKKVLPKVVSGNPLNALPSIVTSNIINSAPPTRNSQLLQVFVPISCFVDVTTFKLISPDLLYLFDENDDSNEDKEKRLVEICGANK